MNNERFPHPNGHPHDDDLQPERWADAPSSDADALDALLNEIAQGNGAPNPRSGLGHQRPDVRTDAGGADALHAATRAFHRRFEAAQHRDPGSTALDPHLWETIMTSTTQQTKRAQGSLWRDATRNALSPGIPSQSRNHVTTRRPAQRWAPVANATLALVILLAGFGVWRVYDGLNGAGTADPEGTTPGVAMQPATPEPTEPPAIQAPPVATPVPITACDFSADIPIFPDVDQSPIDATALLLTTGGDLALTCPEEPEPAVLASGIDQVSPMNWPGIVLLIGEGELGSQPISMLNTIIGKSVQVGVAPEAMRYEWTQPGGSPWLVAPAFENTGVWMITDLRTMESQAFSSFEDSELPPGSTVTPPGTPLLVAGAGDTLVLGIKTNNDIDGEGALFDVEGLPGTLLVLDGSFENAHWIDVPGDLPSTRAMVLSPDGEFLALKSNDGETSFDGTITYSIIRMSDGMEIARSEGVQDFSSTMRWVQQGNALTYTNNTLLMLLSTTAGTDPVTLLESNDALVELGTTYVPDVVIVHRQQAEEVATETPGLVQPRIYSVNTVTGEVIEIDGADASHNLSPWEPDTRFLTMTDTWMTDEATVTYTMVDAVTGEVIDELVDVPRATFPPDQVGLGRRSVGSTDDGGAEVIAFGTQHIYLMRLENGEAVVRRIPPPPKFGTESNGSLELFLSPDGSMLSFTLNGDESRTRWLLPLHGEGDDWIEVPSTVPGEGPAYIFFVPGTGD